MIERREAVQEQRTVNPVRIECDVCGRDATGRRFGMNGLLSSKFYLCGVNTLESRLSETAAINETVVAAVADLCEECAGRVENFLDGLAREHGRDSGTRKRDKYGD